MLANLALQLAIQLEVGNGPSPAGTSPAAETSTFVRTPSGCLQVTASSAGDD